MLKISVLAPVFNEEDNIRPLYDKLTDTLKQLAEDSYEIVFIDDGSRDNSFIIMQALAQEDKKVKYIRLSRNFGHQNAVFAGMEYCSGEAVVIIDTDLQDPPELIHDLYNKMKEGFDVVYAKRKFRKGESWHKLITAKYFYRLINRLSDVEIPLDTGDFRILSKAVCNVVINMPERNKFLRGQIAWTGFRQAHVEYDRQERQRGKTKYSYSKMFKFAMDGISGFSNLPLKVATWLGFATAGIAVTLFIWTMYVRLFTDDYVAGWSSLMVALLFLGGVQLICIGILGEYLGRVLENVRGRPAYIIRETNIRQGENK